MRTRLTTRPKPKRSRYGKEDSMKEAITIAVKTTRTKSRKNQMRYTHTSTRMARTRVPVDMDMWFISRSAIKT